MHFEMCCIHYHLPEILLKFSFLLWAKSYLEKERKKISSWHNFIICSVNFVWGGLCFFQLFYILHEKLLLGFIFLNFLIFLFISVCFLT